MLIPGKTFQTNYILGTNKTMSPNSKILSINSGYFSGFGTWGCQPTLGGLFPFLLLSPSLSPSLPFLSPPPFPLKPEVLCESCGY